jgi:ribosomal protein S18 acetylase RimI-like enzyme
MDMGNYIFAESAESIGQARKLILEYADSLGCSPCLVNIEQEMRRFPEPFAPPAGRLVLAIDHDRPAGVVGVKRIAADSCEMARLYVRPRFRGKGYGKGLALTGMAAAGEAGYRVIRLYTLPSMTTALTMYRKIGFVEISPYSDHPIAEAVYLEYEF